MSIWSADTLRALLAGDLHPLGGPAVAEPLASRVRAAQIGALARYTPGTMSCAVVAAPLVVMLFSDTAAGPYVLLWGFVVSCYSIYLYLRRRAARDGAPRHAVSISAAHRAVRNATLSGAIWAMLPLVALPFAPQHGSLLLCALVGVLGGGAFSLAPLPMAAIAFMAPLGIACAATLHYVESASSLFVIALIVIYVVALIRAVVMYGVQFANGVVQQATHEKAAITDALTGAPNRLGFEERCKAAAASAARLGDSYAVFSIDLDGLKSLNDEFGHAAGDEYLRQAAARMRACLREVDAMARLGGDEFAALGANMEKPQQAAALAQRILRAFEEPFIIGPRKLARTLSIGIAFLPGDGRDVEAVLAKADEALYVAKRQGGSGYRFYQDRDNFEVVSRRRIEEDLPHSIDSDQFDVEFQPFHKLSDLQLSGYEALLRWTHPTLGTVAPSSFIPLAESMGRIHALGERMAQRAIAVARAWPRGVRIAMNLSPAQLRAPHLPTSFERWMREAGL
ncbi:MAG TPA: bifunctional diguanylate cyclase/phosphodiesterase, partial [Beijerinckiaceae bacterium]